MTNFLSNLFSFNGRAGRTEYWTFFIVTGIINFVLELLSKALPVLSIILFLYSLFILVPSIAISVRRLHDLNLSGAWYIAFVAYTLIIIGVLVVMPVTSTSALVIGGIIALLPSIYTAFAPGKNEGNRYTIHTIE